MQALSGFFNEAFEMQHTPPTLSPDLTSSLLQAWIGHQEPQEPTDLVDIANVIADISLRTPDSLIQTLNNFLAPNYHPRASPVDRCLRFMTATGCLFSQDPEHTVSHLVTLLTQQGVVSPPEDEQSNEGIRRTVFIVLGWFTRLYSLSSTESLIAAPEQTPSSYQAPPATSEYSHRPLFEFLTASCRFEQLVGPPTSQGGARQNYFEINSKNLVPASCLNAHIFVEFGQISIDWVDSMTDHLKFDERRRILSLFRLPSFCRLHQAGHSVLRKLSPHIIPISDTGMEDDNAEFLVDFTREILASYTVIFDNKRSSRLYKNRERRKIQRLGFTDPLLDKVCGIKTFWPSMLSVLSISPPIDGYISPSMLPILYPRLRKLSEYVQRRQAHGLSSLYLDRRDSYKWWTFWAVMWIGGGSIVLAFIQTVLSAFSLYYAIRKG